ncbi:MAG: hypothetical protein HY880_08240 [Deltaproteobacteria bacterium]|nr:hypothetical protein [Deltaproteobacteria bacterium]
MFVILDNDGVIHAADRVFAGTLGYDEKDVLGKPLAGFERGETLSERIKSNELLKQTTVSLEGRDKRRIRLLCNTFLLPSWHGGKIVVCVFSKPGETTLSEELSKTRHELERRVLDLEEFRQGVLYMIEDMDRSEGELEDAYTRLKHTHAQLAHSTKMTALGELTAGLEHELTQPVTVIAGLGQSLFNKTDAGTTQHEKLGLIINAAKKMERLIKHLRVFSRLDEPEFETVDFNKVIEDSFLMVRQMLQSDGVEVSTMLNPLPLIRGSGPRLEQVVINLITNARDAMPEGGVCDITTDVLLVDGEPFVRARFSDTGRGIPEHIVHRIFEPFFTTKGREKGTGLGLSISYAIIKEHGGEITVKTSLGKGATFEVLLPAKD